MKNTTIGLDLAKTVFHRIYSPPPLGLKKSVLPTFPWGKRYAMISLIDNPYEGGTSDERHGVVPESSGDCVPVDR